MRGKTSGPTLCVTYAFTSRGRRIADFTRSSGGRRMTATTPVNPCMLLARLAVDRRAGCGRDAPARRASPDSRGIGPVPGIAARSSAQDEHARDFYTSLTCPIAPLQLIVPTTIALALGTAHKSCPPSRAAMVSRERRAARAPTGARAASRSACGQPPSSATRGRVAADEGTHSSPSGFPRTGFFSAATVGEDDGSPLASIRRPSGRNRRRQVVEGARGPIAA